MLHLFRPREYRKMSGFFIDSKLDSDDFRLFQLADLVKNIKNNANGFEFVAQVVAEIKLTPLKSLKVTLLCLRLVHALVDTSIQQSLMNLMHELEMRINGLLRAKKNMKLNYSLQSLKSSSQLIKNDIEFVPLDFSSILLSKIIVPVLHFAQKMLLSYRTLFNPDKLAPSTEQQVWLRMNLLRKILDIGNDMQSIGRYYLRQSGCAIIYLIKVINEDIQYLYRKIHDYFRKKIASIEVIFSEEAHHLDQIIKQHRFRQFLMMIEELQNINQKLRVIYNGRYFVYELVKVNVYLPILFNGEQYLQIIYKIKEYCKWEKKNKSVEVKRITTPFQYAQNV